MLITSRIFGSVLLGFILSNASVFGATAAIEGIVKDANGRLLSGANVKIEAKTPNSWNKVVKTDAKGYYTSALPTDGTYRVTLLVNGAVKASINNVQAKLGDATKLNFDLKKSSASAAKKATHMVYVPSETGTNLGGRWVEVDDSGNPVSAGSERIDRVGANGVAKFQGNSGTAAHGN